MPPHFVFEMDAVCRSFGDKEVLRDISLSFFYGAKIGVVGENGSGKSTLLKIMAGIDEDFQGETKLAPKMKVRYVAQEPELELDKTVRENLRGALKDILAMVDRYNEISVQMCDPEYEDQMDKLLAEMGVLQDRIDSCDGWETDRLMDIVSDAMVLPPDDTPIKQLSGGERRRVALCMALLEKPDLLLLTSRLTIWTRRRFNGWKLRFASITGRLSSLRMTGIFLTISPSGSLSLTRAGDCRSRGTIHRGCSRRPRYFGSPKSVSRRDRRRSPVS